MTSGYEPPAGRGGTPPRPAENLILSFALTFCYAKSMAIKGVNLGGWLVLEKWITPSVFAGTDATDEYTLSTALGDRAASVLEHHRATFITEQDFAWLAAHGIAAVRIPVGYWLFGDEPPFIGGISHLDDAFRWAAAHNIQVLLDIHGAPGSQNGWDHSGKSGNLGWHTKRAHIERTLAFVQKLTERYGQNPQLWGIELLNEPHWNVPKKILARYYDAAYAMVREHAAESVAVVISDAFRPYDWADVLPAPLHTNVMLDRHFYQCFSDADKALSMPGHLQLCAVDWQQDVAALQLHKPVIAGEWSLALEGDVSAEDRAAYARAQLATLEHTAAWFFWTYKTEDSPEWDLRRSATLLGLQPKRA